MRTSSAASSAGYTAHSDPVPRPGRRTPIGSPNLTNKHENSPRLSAPLNFPCAYQLCRAHRRDAKRSTVLVDEAVFNSGSLAAVAYIRRRNCLSRLRTVYASRSRFAARPWRKRSASALFDERSSAYWTVLASGRLGQAGDQEISDAAAMLRFLGQPPRHPPTARPGVALVVRVAVLGGNLARLSPRSPLLAGDLGYRPIPIEFVDRITVLSGECDHCPTHRGNGATAGYQLFPPLRGIQKGIEFRQAELFDIDFHAAQGPAMPISLSSTNARAWANAPGLGSRFVEPRKSPTRAAKSSGGDMSLPPQMQEQPNGSVWNQTRISSLPLAVHPVKIPSPSCSRRLSWAYNRAMEYQLIIKFWRKSLADEAFLATIEAELKQALGATVELEGLDVSAKEINLFMLTSDPRHSFRRAKDVLERLGTLNAVSAAFRLSGGAQLTSIWPLRSTRKFKLP
ncbi:histone family nucleoid-structuring H-NS domain protein [Lysobacter gummosus]|nr:histone family nucleoid-structuring H-NS domain protein [Lysobacter gummosus]